MEFFRVLAQVGVLFKSTNWSQIDLPRLNWSVILEVYILGLLSQSRERESG